MINVHGLRRNVKNVVKNYTYAQIRVREATSNDPWGPSGTLMSEIADLTYNVVAFSEIMDVLWKRLNDHGKNWKHVYKALVLMEYLLKSGSEKVAQQCKERMFAIETLKDFQYVEESKDQGVNVREKAKQLVALLKDDERLKNERTRALKARERFAQAKAGVRQDFIQRERNSGEFVQRRSSMNDEFMSHGIFLSELEQVRPQTIGEEELQLQLALAMSKEESDQSERLKRNDDLRLQMALSESKESFERCSQPSESKDTAPSTIKDLEEIFASVKDNQQTVGYTRETKLYLQETVTYDPWGMPVEPVQSRRYPHSYTLPSGLNQNSMSASPSLENPNISEGANANNNLLNLNTAFHTPDLITSTANASGPYDMSNLRKSLSADVAISEFAEQHTPSPQRFLGNNVNLVNLDSLVEYPAPVVSSASNPFQPDKSPQPSMNEIRVQNNSFASSPLPPTHSPHHRSGNEMSGDSNAMPSNNPFL